MRGRNYADHPTKNTFNEPAMRLGAAQATVV
jgi:hypothetical protein